jgi:hypothetical protein
MHSKQNKEQKPRLWRMHRINQVLIIKSVISEASLDLNLPKYCFLNKNIIRNPIERKSTCRQTKSIKVVFNFSRYPVNPIAEIANAKPKATRIILFPGTALLPELTTANQTTAINNTTTRINNLYTTIERYQRVKLNKSINLKTTFCGNYKSNKFW